MNDCEGLKEDSRRNEDQTDGQGMSLGKKKGVTVTGRNALIVEQNRRRGGPSINHYSTDTSVFTSVSPQLLRHPEDYSRMDNSEVEWETHVQCQNRSPCGEVGVPRQTMEELKSVLRETSFLSTRGRDEDRPGRAYMVLHGGSDGSRRPSGRNDDGNPHRAFSTFKPPSEASGRGGPPRESTPIELPSPMDSSSSLMSNANTNRQQRARTPSYASGSSWRDCGALHSDNGIAIVELSGNQRFSTAMEQIKQRIAWENINFVRFEATDLHGVSRSKTVPLRFFHEKAVYGIPMPRSYLELTLSPKSNEVDHANAANFSSDILLIPDLSTFRVLPWAEQTARVICDPCTVTGCPLLTSPRLIAKQLLGQLQSLGFSLHSSFTYECCVLGTPDRVGPKTLLFPATTLLSNHDLPFFQQLVDSMYCMGADIDSIASASGPGQMEINLRPEFGISAADSAFTFRTSIKEMARKHSYIASFFTDDGLYNAGVLSHSLWDANGRRSLFHSGERADELSEIGRKWLAGLLTHSAALSCLMSPGLGCRSHIAKRIKDPKRLLYATCGTNDNSSSFNIKNHGGRELHIDNKLGSAMANPYIVLAATVAAGLDGIRRKLTIDCGLNKAPSQQRDYAIPVKLDDALEALGEDQVIRSALGEPFVQYFIAMKKFEIETQELDDERNKCLEYFI